MVMVDVSPWKARCLVLLAGEGCLVTTVGRGRSESPCSVCYFESWVWLSTGVFGSSLVPGRRRITRRRQNRVGLGPFYAVLCVARCSFLLHGVGSSTLVGKLSCCPGARCQSVCRDSCLVTTRGRGRSGSPCSVWYFESWSSFKCQVFQSVSRVVIRLGWQRSVL